MILLYESFTKCSLLNKKIPLFYRHRAKMNQYKTYRLNAQV